MRPLNKTYLYRLLDRAVNNQLFEFNWMGKYRIHPKHTPHQFVYILFKSHKHLATIKLQNKWIELQLNKPTKREVKIFEHFFETVYDKKPLKVLEL